MKDNINYYYNLNINEVENWDNYYRFKLDNNTFYFVPYKRDISELDDIINVSREMKQKNIEIHDIILNRYGKPLTNIYNENYVLLKPNGDYLDEYSLNNIIKINKILTLNPNKSNLYRVSWVKMWSSKIDYFEYQVHELGKDKILILDSFSYYVGLGENAISYASYIVSNIKPTINDKITLSHKRINIPNYKLNYLNPLTFIFDLEIRDLAEYLKSSFFYGNDAYKELSEVLKKKTFSNYSLGLLYARLLYPTYYFDLYEKIMNSNEEQDILVPIIEKADSYQEFLKKAYLEISKYAVLPQIDWLMNQK